MNIEYVGEVKQVKLLFDDKLNLLEGLADNDKVLVVAANNEIVTVTPLNDSEVDKNAPF